MRSEIQDVDVNRRAYSRIGFRVIRGQGELVGREKVYGKYGVVDDIFDHSSESVNSFELGVFLRQGLSIVSIFFAKRDSILSV